MAVVSTPSRGLLQRDRPAPELLDAKALQAELGVTRAAAEAIMRRLPVVEIEGLRKVYVRRDDVAATSTSDVRERPGAGVGWPGTGCGRALCERPCGWHWWFAPDVTEPEGRGQSA